MSNGLAAGGSRCQAGETPGRCPLDPTSWIQARSSASLRTLLRRNPVLTGRHVRAGMGPNLPSKHRGPPRVRGGPRAAPGRVPRPDQYWSDETTSPPLRVRIERKAARLIVALTNRTEPSPKRALTPPEWYENGSSFGPAWLPAVATVVGQGDPSFVGWPEVPKALPGSAHRQ